jgi:hypothetical protein
LSYLKNKSDFNIIGAELRIDNSLYAPSIHCSYYSVFQLMKTVYCDKKNITFEDYSVQARNQEGSSHNTLIQNFCNLYPDRRESLKFSRRVRGLKASRIKSDYDNFQIDFDFSNKAFGLPSLFVTNFLRPLC